MTLETLSGPVIGAVIGYFTNYIAVKMLFYPRKEIKVFGHRLPFTPGAIPKGKPRLAKAVGNIVAGTLFTKEDIKNSILSPETEALIMEKVTEAMCMDIRTGVQKLCSSENDYKDLKEKMTTVLTAQVMESVKHIDIGGTIAEKSQTIIREKINGTMLKMFLNDELIASFIRPISEEVDKYIDENGEAYIEDEIRRKINTLECHSVMDLCEEMDIQKETVDQTISAIYHSAVDKAVDSLLGEMNIAGIIEEKIDKMPVEDLEKMVLSIMKKELDTIVNLGALVGAVLGIFNMFF